MANIIGKNAVGSLMHAGHNTNPLHKIGVAPGWKHVDTKFGLNTMQAEAHRKVLAIQHGTAVKKILANFHLNEWHYHAKVIVGRIK